MIYIILEWFSGPITVFSKGDETVFFETIEEAESLMNEELQKGYCTIVEVPVEAACGSAVI